MTRFPSSVTPHGPRSFVLIREAIQRRGARAVLILNQIPAHNNSSSPSASPAGETRKKLPQCLPDSQLDLAKLQTLWLPTITFEVGFFLLLFIIFSFYTLFLYSSSSPSPHTWVKSCAIVEIKDVLN